jgi:integral membrane protein (TIGR01906 family)
MRKSLEGLIGLGLLVFSLMFFAQLLTSRTYMNLSQGRYAAHTQITYDHRYVAHQLIDYLNYRHDDLTFGASPDAQEILMRDIEIRHMVDVKALYTLLRWVAVGALVFSVGALSFIYRRDRRWFYDILKHSYRLPLVFTAVMAITFALAFDRAFILFHELFFDNDDWLLRGDDVLIQLLPQNFWLVSASLILVGVVGWNFVLHKVGKTAANRL